MKVTRARILRRGEAGAAKPLAVPGGARTGADPTAPLLSPPSARIVARPVAEARAQAEALLRQAREEAQHILSRADATAHDLIVQQQARARADALSLVVGEALELRKRQAELSRNVLDRSIGFAKLLAERLLGEELQLSPDRVLALARQALKEAAGARQAVVVASPRDAGELRSGLTSLGSLLESIAIQEDARLQRGHIRVETELGVIEADVGGQLDRLAAQLRKLLQTHADPS